MQIPSFISRSLCTLLLAALASPAAGQTKAPVISNRVFTAGNAKVTVTGAFSFTRDIAMNLPASLSSDGSTWLQFGVSGSAEPHATITYSVYEVGVTVAQGKMLATGGVMYGEKSECSGKVDVKPTLITGQYTCVGVTSHDPVTGKMGKVNIEVVFLATS